MQPPDAPGRLHLLYGCFSAKPILPYAPIRKADAFTVIRSVFRAALYILPRTPDHTIRPDSFHREPLWRYE